jgi:hypothetical protein
MDLHILLASPGLMWLPTDSLLLGIPLLSDSASGKPLFSADPDLARQLVVPAYDVPMVQMTIAALIPQIPVLSHHVRDYSTWLNIKAQREWDLFTTGNTALQQQDYLLRTAVQTRVSTFSRNETRVRVAFVAYELALLSEIGGTVSVGVTGIILDLLSAGHAVVVIAYLPAPRIAAWQLAVTQMGAKLGEGGLLIVDAQAIVKDHEAQILRSENIFMRRTYELAFVAQYVYERTPFDVIEYFDWVATGFHLLRSKLEGRNLLPPTVQVVIRIHGTLQLMHAASNVTNSDRYVAEMYLMERYDADSMHKLLDFSLG